MIQTILQRTVARLTAHQQTNGFGFISQQAQLIQITHLWPIWKMTFTRRQQTILVMESI